MHIITITAKLKIDFLDNFIRFIEFISFDFLSSSKLFSKNFKKISLAIFSSTTSLNLSTKFLISISAISFPNSRFASLIFSNSFFIFKHSIFSKYSLYSSILFCFTNSPQEEYNFLFASFSTLFFFNNSLLLSISSSFQKFNDNPSECKKSYIFALFNTFKF